jgi:hypothetical protein
MARSFVPRALGLVLRAAAWTVGLYVVLWLVSSIWVGHRSPNLDTDRGLHNVYRTDVREFLYHLPAFCEQARGRNNLIFVGGSTSWAYSPDEIAPYVKGWTVSRVSLDFSNVTQMRQTIALLRQCMGKETFARSRIVIGLSYVSMAPDATRFPTPYTMLELEQKRHGLFVGGPRALRPIVPWEQMGLVVDAGRPVILAHDLATRVKDELGQVRQAIGRLRQGAVPKLDAAAHEASELAAYDGFMGKDAAFSLRDQGDQLAALIAEVRAAGSDVIVIAVPQKVFVRKKARYIDAYYDWLTAFAQDHALTVLRHDYADADFYDGSHASPEGAVRWSRAVAPSIAAILSASSSEPNPDLRRQP